MPAKDNRGCGVFGLWHCDSHWSFYMPRDPPWPIPMLYYSQYLLFRLSSSQFRRSALSFGSCPYFPASQSFYCNDGLPGYPLPVAQAFAAKIRQEEGWRALARVKSSFAQTVAVCSEAMSCEVNVNPEPFLLDKVPTRHWPISRTGDTKPLGISTCFRQ